MHRLSVFTLALFLSTGWGTPEGWGAAIVRITATALGVETQQSPAQLPPHDPPTESGCSMDPWGCPESGNP
jgi:hypothetical protein